MWRLTCPITDTFAYRYERWQPAEHARIVLTIDRKDAS